MDMRRSLKSVLSAVLVTAAVFVSATSAKASLVITFAEVGSDVVANGVGGLNFLDLSFVNFELGPNFVDASSGAVLLGPVPQQFSDIYTGAISGPTSFGAGGNVAATSGSSTAPFQSGAGINGAAGFVYLPGGYSANDPFTVSSTWANTTIAGLGLTPGTYTWTWGTNNPDSLTVIIPGAVDVPEPSSLMMVFGAASASLLCIRKRKRVA